MIKGRGQSSQARPQPLSAQAAKRRPTEHKHLLQHPAVVLGSPRKKYSSGNCGMRKAKSPGWLASQHEALHRKKTHWRRELLSRLLVEPRSWQHLGCHTAEQICLDLHRRYERGTQFPAVAECSHWHCSVLPDIHASSHEGKILVFLCRPWVLFSTLCYINWGRLGFLSTAQTSLKDSWLLFNMDGCVVFLQHPFCMLSKPRTRMMPILSAILSLAVSSHQLFQSHHKAQA